MSLSDLEFFENIFIDLNKGFGKEYNLFSCSEAILIAETLKTKEKIIEFSNNTSDQQLIMVPNLSNEHSGGTFSLACKLAILYIPRLRENIREEKINDIIT